MNYKSKNQISVSDIFSNDNGYEFLAAIKNFSSLRKWIAVGENISSDEFCLIFGNSIGVSNWKLCFYPNGQYLDEKAGHHVGIYLVLLSCENNSALTANVTFRLKPVKDGEHEGYVARLDKEFTYSIPTKRWIGKPDFVGKNWLHSKQFKEKFLNNDTLTISCLINELYIENDFKLEVSDETTSTISEISINDQNRKVSCWEEKARDCKNNGQSGWTLVDRKRGKGSHDNRDTNNGGQKQKNKSGRKRNKKHNKQGGKKKK